MHDLVVLDNTTVGVIVNVEQDALRVLTNQVRVQCCWEGGGGGGGEEVLRRAVLLLLHVCLLLQTGGLPLSIAAAAAAVAAALQGRPDKPDVRLCRLPDIKRKMDNRRASVKDGGAAAGGGRQGSGSGKGVGNGAGWAGRGGASPFLTVLPDPDSSTVSCPSRLPPSTCTHTHTRTLAPPCVHPSRRRRRQ